MRRLLIVDMENRTSQDDADILCADNWSVEEVIKMSPSKCLVTYVNNEEVALSSVPLKDAYDNLCRLITYHNTQDSHTLRKIAQERGVRGVTRLRKKMVVKMIVFLEMGATAFIDGLKFGIKMGHYCIAEVIHLLTCLIGNKGTDYPEVHTFREEIS